MNNSRQNGILRTTEPKPAKARAMPMINSDELFKGAREVAGPITSATIATVVIFIPLAFVGGIIGEMFIPFAITITFALIASLMVALMVIPPLTSFPVSGKAGIPKKDPWYQRAYTFTLKWSLKHQAATLNSVKGRNTQH